ncbi:hypothetical protein BGW36DRAFT_396304 [Talaromyces proteolyticus]|uniref:Uncharacterized protein n=1 Tax=Talaromyces proteolyticus TaxID=1131652 RepID=A0AAD4Q1B9_9EURO|nr:uncharacterized protein BGW36DRAFT_396304 [Talaromyces proteolyticus]KAH8698549.1 hypothetical protein BGW36DRAFT_396304 [Talaromyces proteolyticus]
MDLQGTPIGNTGTGTKVTTDPASYKPVQENPGPITNDSLAADSVRQHGAFAQNSDSQPLGVSGSKSTFNNTDTSGATQLSSAPQASARENPSRQERYPDALGGQGDYPGKHLPESGYAGGSTRAKKELGIGTKQYNTQERQAATAGGSNNGYRSAYNGGTAASYIAPVTETLGSTKPHGKNLQEGGFESNDSANASFNTDIGSRKDPGRLAENKIQRKAAESGAAYTNTTVDATQPYGNLQHDQRA